MNALNTSSRALTFVVLTALALGGCRPTSQTPETKSQPAVQTNTETTRQVAAEKPSLSAQIENLSLYPVPNNRKNLAISLVVTVRNAGSPATAEGWTLTVNSPTRNFNNLNAVLVNGLVEMPGAAGAQIDLRKEDLAIKGKQTPIGKGAQLKGVLTFVLSDALAQDLSNNNSTVFLRFRDNQGSSYQSPKAIIAERR